MDTKLTFWDHIRMASDKAATVTTALSRLMANVHGPRSEKRRLLMAYSILLYGSEVWADALKKKTYRKRVAGVQYRGALRIACSYHTVSEPAVLAIARWIPVDILAFEWKRIFEKTPENVIKMMLDSEKHREVISTYLRQKKKEEVQVAHTP